MGQVHEILDSFLTHVHMDCVPQSPSHMLKNKQNKKKAYFKIGTTQVISVTLISIVYMNGVLYFHRLKRSCAFLCGYFATNQPFGISRICVQTKTLREELIFIIY